MKLLLMALLLSCAWTRSLSQPIWNCGTWCSAPRAYPTPSPPTTPTNTIVSVVVADGRFQRLVAAVTSAGLAPTLSGSGPFTVFAPLDTAFASVPAKFLTPQYSEHLRQVLLYHVVGARVLAGSLRKGMSIPTLNTANNITVTDPPPGVELNGSVDVVVADVLASNGVIHVIDEVLLPNQVTLSILDLALATPNLSTLVSLLSAAGIANLFGDDSASFTVFAPTNAAFAKLAPSLVTQLTNPANVVTLRNVLQFHVIGGSVVRSNQLVVGQRLQSGLSVTSVIPPRVNNAGIVAADILASNGVIHLIDNVLIPPTPNSMPVPMPQTMPVRAPTTPALSPIFFNCGTWCNTSPRANPTPTPPTTPSNTGTIVNVAVADGRFKRLVEAVTSAGLAPTLSGRGPFTVFAPLDTAFANVPAKFLTPQYSEHLRQVLLYHVVGARVLAGSLRAGMSIPTLNTGNNITVTDPPPGVELNGRVDVVVADVLASNGVIHVIDEVLLPSQVTLSILDLALATPNLSTLASLLSAAGIANLFGDDSASFTVFAPTNAAFAKLAPSLVTQLTNPANAVTLRNVLQFHVIGGSVVRSNQLVVGQRLQSGLSVTSVTPPRVNNAGIVAADILASNGVIHLIDTVLIPAALPPGPIAVPTVPRPTVIFPIAASPPTSSTSRVNAGGSNTLNAIESSSDIRSTLIAAITAVWCLMMTYDLQNQSMTD